MHQDTYNCDLLGIDVGSINVKLCHLTRNEGERYAVTAHEGNLDAAVRRLLTELRITGETTGMRALATGAEGRHRFDVPEVIAPVSIEHGLRALGLRPRAVVSMGGEDLVLYVLDAEGRILNTYAGNKCASGTGEFFRQQLGRMDLRLEDLDEAMKDARVQRLSARCSVFMKSDCTHRLNKGEATKGDIALSMSKVMADKVSEFMTKAGIYEGEVVLIGGVTGNQALLGFLAETWPAVRLLTPEQAPYFEAFGAATLAAEQGGDLPEPARLLRPGEERSYATFPPLRDAHDNVHYAPSMRGELRTDAEYILGVDGGSTTTKVALVDSDTLQIVAAHYGRTHGDPIGALRLCVREVLDQLGPARPRISLAATTGSSRELLGVFLQTAGVYNEIIAHTVGTLHFEPQADTIFEIGGQDAKYVCINNGVPIDYAMNEACSAGTGSFLEESAQGDLSIDSAEQIGPLALRAEAPLKFGEHCSAFINSDIRKAIGQGSSREDVVAGLVCSIVANYVNRVVGNRRVGSHVVLQGGVAKNPAVPLAFAQLLSKRIVVPPDPELMGCFGVARLAKQKRAEGLLESQAIDLHALLDRPIVYRDSFTCKSCDNSCEIRRIETGNRRYPFGGRCSLHTRARRKRGTERDAAKDPQGVEAVDYTAVRTRMLFHEYVPPPDDLTPRTDKVVGVPLAFSVHSLWPFYAWFFHSLGVRTRLSERVAPEGIARQESSYCFPAEIAHGTLQDVLDQRVDYVFLPHFRDMPSMEAGEVHARTCPLTQGLPYFARHAFGLDETKILRPLVSLKHGWEGSRGPFVELAERLGFRAEQGAAAYERGRCEYERFMEAYAEQGRQLLEQMRQHPEHLYVALAGRPYNAFSRDANMGIPRKLTSQGATVVPFDMIFDPQQEIFPNMYWYYGQQDMKAVARVSQVDNLYLTWVSNFSCAPDSFMLHYVRWMMGQKPYLVLEIDSHTADAGVDTRVEAFLDIVESYRAHVVPVRELPQRRRLGIALKKNYCDIVDHKTGVRVDIRDPRVTLVWPSMGELGVRAMSTASRKQGIQSVHLPVPDVHSTQLARSVASGKECIPALLVLGSVLRFFQQNPPNLPNQYWAVFVPSTLGPCRTGQYHVFFDRLFEQMGWHNVVQLVAGSENSYRELGPTFNRDVWRGIVIADFFTDIRTGIRLLALNPAEGLRLFDRVWRRVLAGLQTSDRDLDRALRWAGQELAAIPKKLTLEEVKKVLVVGEIYVRRDDFSVHELNAFLISKGIFPKVTGVAEWFHYTDYARGFLMAERRRREGWLKTLRAGALKEEGLFQVEGLWKQWVERRIRNHLEPCGFIPDVPEDMSEIIGEGQKTFIDPELESEATVSPAVAAAAMHDGYSGVSVIAPFGCLPGRLIEGVYGPWAKARGFPVIALENDGQPYPPNVISRLEVFAHNVLRFDKSAQAHGEPMATEQRRLGA